VEEEKVPRRDQHGHQRIAAGAREVMTTVLDELDKRGIENVEVAVTGGSGLTRCRAVICVEDKSGREGQPTPNVNCRRRPQDRSPNTWWEAKIVDGLAGRQIKEPPLQRITRGVRWTGGRQKPAEATGTHDS